MNVLVHTSFNTEEIRQMLYPVCQINLYCEKALSWIWIVVLSCAKCGPAALESPETLLEIQSLSPWKAE